MADSEDPEGHIYVYFLDDEGEVGEKLPFFCFATQGRAPEAEFDANGIVVDPDGCVSVARSELGVITKISEWGVLLGEVPLGEFVDARVERAVTITWPGTCDFRLWVDSTTTEWDMRVRLSATTGIVPQRMRLTRLGRGYLQLDVIPEPPAAATAP